MSNVYISKINWDEFYPWSFFSHFLALSGVLHAGVLNVLHFSNLLRNSSKKCRLGPITFFPKHAHSLGKVFFCERIPAVFFFQLWQLRSEVLVHSIVWIRHLSQQFVANRGKYYGTRHTVKFWSQNQNLTSIQQHKFQCAKTKQGTEDRSHHSRSTYHPSWALPCFHQC